MSSSTVLTLLSLMTTTLFGLTYYFSGAISSLYYRHRPAALGGPMTNPTEQEPASFFSKIGKFFRKSK
jgi:hypothetical protein